jgi:hypothetical protein
MKCRCGYQFIFVPNVDKITDNRFATAIKKASANDTCYFTMNQLEAVVRRMEAKNPWVSGIVSLISLLVVVSLVYFDAADGVVIGAFVIFSISLLVWLARILRKPTYLDVPQLFERWQRRNGTVEKFISEPKLNEPPPEWTEPDIYDYGVERILIVERDILVDLLVKNNFHAEQGALILSEHGYPSYIEARAQTILKESPGTKVFLMHDSTKTGVGMKGRVMTKYGLSDDTVVDLGVFPDDWKKQKAARPLGLRHDNYEAPVDLLTYPRLGAVTGAAFLAGVPFLLLPPPPPGSPDSVGDGNSFG